MIIRRGFYHSIVVVFLFAAWSLVDKKKEPGSKKELPSGIQLSIDSTIQDTMKYDHQVIDDFMLAFDNTDKLALNHYLQMAFNAVSQEVAIQGIRLYEEYYGELKSYEIKEFDQVHSQGIIQVGAVLQLEFEQVHVQGMINLLETAPDTIVLHSFATEMVREDLPFLKAPRAQIEEALMDRSVEKLVRMLPKEYRPQDPVELMKLSTFLEQSLAYAFEGHEFSQQEGMNLVHLYHRCKMSEKGKVLRLHSVFELLPNYELQMAAFNFHKIQ